MTQNKMTLLFEYWRETGERQELVARGEQRVACMRRKGEELVPTPIIEELRSALRLYAAA
jgi:enediyne biosynthesis thioesterase